MAPPAPPAQSFRAFPCGNPRMSAIRLSPASSNSAMARFSSRPRGATSGGQATLFHFYFTQLTGNGTIIARVDSISDAASNGWEKAGVMIRNTLYPESDNAMVTVSPNGKVGFQNRATAGALSSVGAYSTVTGPVWIQLTRNNQTIIRPILRGRSRLVATGHDV